MSSITENTKLLSAVNYAITALLGGNKATAKEQMQRLESSKDQ